MKAQCERCKEIVELRFAVGDDGIHVTCPACAAAYFVAAAGTVEAAVQTAVEDDKSVPHGTPCPKCGHRQASGESCRKCGLIFARWTPQTTASGDPEGEALWTGVEKAWSDEARHDAVLAWVQRSGQFAWLAGRYRVARDQRGGADEMATRSLAKLEKLALTTLAMSGSKRAGEPAETPYKKSMIVLITLLALAAVGLVWAMATRSPRGEEPAPAGPVVPKPRSGAK